MSTMPNPLQGQGSNPLGWPGQTGTNMPGIPGGPSLFGSPPSASPAGATGTTNPYGFGTKDGGALAANLAETNLQTGLARNALIPWFTKMMGGSAGPAMDFFKQLMNLGSPYYQQQQQASFGQGVNHGENAAALSKQRLNASGYGAAPSGMQAAMLGGEATGQAQNLSQMYLQNLFQNEMMQMGGAQGLSSLAQLFNPASLLGQTSTSIQQPTNTAAETMSAIGQMAGGIFGAGGIPTGQGK
jgi:hypothetical protein